MFSTKFTYGDDVRLTDGRTGFVMCLSFPFRYDGFEHYEIIIDGRYRLSDIPDCDIIPVKKWTDA